MYWYWRLVHSSRERMEKEFIVQEEKILFVKPFFSAKIYIKHFPDNQLIRMACWEKKPQEKYHVDIMNSATVFNRCSLHNLFLMNFANQNDWNYHIISLLTARSREFLEATHYLVTNVVCKVSYRVNSYSIHLWKCLHYFIWHKAKWDIARKGNREDCVFSTYQNRRALFIYLKNELPKSGLWLRFETLTYSRK